VPRAEFRSYYGRRILNPPVWRSPDLPGYLFLGGLAGASSVLAAGAQATGSTALATRCKVVAVGAIGAASLALVHELGRPERFYNMLRVFKPTSPISVGAWLLTAYGPIAGVAAATGVSGRLAGVGAVATTAAAALGPLVSTYTAAVISNTAVPAWHEGFREMPFVFAGSSATAAGGIGMVVAPRTQSAPALRIAAAGAAIELVAAARMQKRLGALGEPYRKGGPGRMIRAGQALTAGGLLLAATRRRSRLSAFVAGCALAGASALTRFGIFEAGKASAEDPAFVVVPQRGRLTAHSEARA
jgi:hypothetical protein